LEGGGDFSATLAVLASALGCGLLMGIERERRKGQGPGRGPAGIRTFTLTSLAGGVAAVLGSPALIAVGAVFVAALGLLSAWRDKLDPGMTTEVALLLAYLIGVMCATSQPLAAALAVAATVLLAARNTLHRFSRHWLQPGEARDGLMLAALALLVVPLVPDRPLWGNALNPQVVARLLVVLLLIQSAAHVGRRLMQARHALGLASLASGFVSSTATIATLGMQARSTPAQARLQAGAGVLSCAATMVQLLVVAATVQPAWLLRLAAPAAAATLVALAWGAWLMRPAAGYTALENNTAASGARTAQNAAAMAPPALSPSADSQGMAPAPGPVTDSRMFKLRDAALVALLLTTVQAAVHGLKLAFGDAGLLAGALLAALADLHAATAAVLLQGTPADAGSTAMAHALMAAVLVHAASKSVVAAASGGWRFACYAVPGIWVHSLVFAGGLLVQLNR
jgi:uncharacterized membrane protein (DUF4010 family)